MIAEVTKQKVLDMATKRAISTELSRGVENRVIEERVKINHLSNYKEQGKDRQLQR